MRATYLYFHSGKRILFRLFNEGHDRVLPVRSSKIRVLFGIKVIMSKPVKIGIAVVILAVILIGALLSIVKARKALINSPSLITVIDIYNRIRPSLNFSNNEDCLKKLEKSGVQFFRVRDSITELGCVVKNAVKVTRSHIPYQRPFMSTCSLALALHDFELQVLKPLALKHFNKEIVEIEHLGTYSCRPMRGYKGLLSEHAYANAIDIAAFKLSDGKKVTIKDHWEKPVKNSSFLREVANGACSVFNRVLTPELDRNHADHFHFDQGFFRKCR